MQLGFKSDKFPSVSNSLLELSQGNKALLDSDFVTTKNEKRVAVRITAEDVEALEPQLAEYNFQTIASSPENHFIEGFIHPTLITELATLESEGLMGVMPIYKPITRVGDVTSQADFIHESDRVRSALPTGFDGTGITVGVMSDSYDNLGGAAADVASGDLPDGVNVLQDLEAGGSDEGRAMAQLIYDLAPNVDIAFSSVFFGQADFAQQIRDLADPTKGDSDILVDDIGYADEPFFQDGVIARAIDDVVTNNGVTFFSAAGNDADRGYESDNINFVNDSSFFSGSFYDFDPGAEVDVSQSITLDPGQNILLSFQWDDPFYTVDGVDTDLDLYLIDSAGEVVAAGTNYNIENQTPVETFSFLNDTETSQTYELYINKFEGPDPERIKYINLGDRPAAVEYPIDDSTIYGHPAAVNAQAVAAVPWYAQENPEPFTSLGSTTILFEPDGTRKAVPEIRQTPDVAAIDGTNTTFFGTDSVFDDDDLPNFFGTSAAAPHAAAIAALIKDADPNLTPEQIYTRLQSTAKDVGAPGFDNLTGNGLINAYDAVFGSVMAADLDFKDNFEDGDLPIFYETNSTGAGRIQVTQDNEPIGTKHLTLDSAADGIGNLSLNEVILYVDASESSNVKLSFDHKEFNDFDDPMPESFVGSSNSDGVALSVDGDTWYRLVSLTGDNSTNTYSPKNFNLSTVAAANGLTLGSDVQIKFQQFDEFEIDRNGMAFDNISVTKNPSGTQGDDFLEGTSEDDTIRGFAGNDTIKGFEGSDRLIGASGNDSLSGGLGSDTLIGSHGMDNLYGDGDDDNLDGGKDNDRLFGGSGNDTLRGSDDNDISVGNQGDDKLFGGLGDDNIIGNQGEDRLRGESGSDVLIGGGQNDILLGGDNADSLTGASGEDNLRGGEGADVLNGGAGEDSIITGSGQDTVVLLVNLTTADRDIIRDFDLNSDRLGLSNMSQIDNLSVMNNINDTASIITNGAGEHVAVLGGIIGITMSDLNFVEV